VALSERLAIIIDANGAGAVREFEKVGKSAERELGNTESRATRVGASLTQMGAVMIGVGAVLVGGAIKAAQAFEEEQLAVLKLQNTIDSMPKLAGATTDAFLEQAAALQKSTKFADDQTIAAQAMLGTFHLTEQQILSLMPLVQDYAAKFSVDLVDASKQVGKAVMGQRGALQRNGVLLDENAYKADKFSAVMEALRENAGGFANQEAQTMSGQLEILRNRFGDVTEAVGQGAAGAFGIMLTPVRGVLELLQNMPSAVSNAVGGFAAFGGVGLIFAGAASIMIGQLMLMKTRFTEAFEAAKRFAAFIKKNASVEMFRSAAAFAAAAGAVALVTYGIYRLSQEIGKAKFGDFSSDADGVRRSLEELGRTGNFTGVLSDIDALVGAKDSIREYKDSIDAIADSGIGKFGSGMEWKAFGEGVREGTQVAADNIKVIDEQLTDLYQTSVTKASAAWDELVQRFTAGGYSMAEIEAMFPGFIAAQQAGKESTGELNQETRLLTEALTEQRDALNALFDPVFGAIDAVDGLRDAQNKSLGAAMALGAAEKAHADAVAQFGENSPQAVEAAMNLMEAQENLRDAQLGAVEAAQRQEGAFITLASEMAKNGESTAAFEGKLAEWVAQGWITQEQAARIKDEFYRVRDAANQIPATTQATIESNAGDVAAQVERLRDALKGVNYSDLNNGVERIIFGPFVGRASGGPVTARTPYLVGESGPELFMPNGSGTIVPENRTRMAMAGASAVEQSAATYNITINGLVGRDKQDVLDFLARELPKAAATQARSYG
jgi:polyhydroxyalkanoate synthesis regulator phasin